MPGRDRTGPMGSGPMSGRGTGLCVDNTAHDNNSPASSFGKSIRRGFACGFGNGYRGGMGRGRGGHGRMNFAATDSFARMQAPLNKQQKLLNLKSQAEYLENSLNNIREELAELEK